MRQGTEGSLLAQGLIVVVGPTASGKTDLAVDLARRFDGEIISADSRQVYRGLDAGTAKPVRGSQGLVEGVPYHLLDAADLSERFDAGRFARLAESALQEIVRRGRTPIVAGGTGLYVRALLQGLAPLPAGDAAVRARLAAQARADGREKLHARLTAVDPAAAAKIPPANIQRLIRALEVFELTGKPISSFWSGDRPARPAKILLIEWPADELRARIKARAETMWPAMLEEVRALLAAGAPEDAPGFQSLGYKDAVACARGRLSGEAGLAALIAATCAYAKRQRTWFRGQTPGASVVRGGTRAEMLAQSLKLLEARHAAALAR